MTINQIALPQITVGFLLLFVCAMFAMAYLILDTFLWCIFQRMDSSIGMSYLHNHEN